MSENSHLNLHLQPLSSLSVSTTKFSIACLTSILGVSWGPQTPHITPFLLKPASFSEIYYFNQWYHHLSSKQEWNLKVPLIFLLFSFPVTRSQTNLGLSHPTVNLRNFGLVILNFLGSKTPLRIFWKPWIFSEKAHLHRIVHVISEGSLTIPQFIHRFCIKNSYPLGWMPRKLNWCTARIALAWPGLIQTEAIVDWQHLFNLCPTDKLTVLFAESLYLFYRLFYTRPLLLLPPALPQLLAWLFTLSSSFFFLSVCEVTTLTQ